MYTTDPSRGRMSFGGFGGGGPVAQDIWILLGVVLFTFSLRFFSGVALIPALLQLTPLVYQQGFLWQLVTYPFVGTGVPSLWFLIELLILFWFTRDVFNALGRKRFWRTVMTSAFAGALVASLVQLISDLASGVGVLQPFELMQGQRMLMTIVIVAFAVLYAQATILLFFVLPVQARWFVWIVVLMAFMGFLGTKDLAGFLGLLTAVGMTIAQLRGGLANTLRRWWLRMRQKMHQSELKRMRDKRGMRVVPGGKEDAGRRGPWVN